MNTFYHGDCHFVMGHDIEPESIDLICLDPPFFTGQVQKGKLKWEPGAMECTYEDSRRFWQEKGLASHAPTWLKDIAINRPDFAAYLFYMRERLQACHRVLKATGSIYLHCDWRASHYLKMVLDEIFSWQNFQNEVVWCYKGGNARQRFRRKHDVILFYTKSPKYCFNANATRRPYSQKILDITEKDADGNFYYKTGQNEKGKVYLHPQGQLPYDWWDDVPSSTSAHGKEMLGYPTQKPLALLERIIKASSNEGDMVLDPFCGCGTAIIAAQRLNRRWIGIDINRQAYEVSGKRIGELPLDFAHFRYVERTMEDVLGIDKPKEFENWVNEFYKATKPHPDKGIDGITPDCTPIQVKTFTIGYSVVSQFVTDAKYHPHVRQPVSKVIIVSQTGFDDGARKRKFEIESAEGIEVQLSTLEEMLCVSSLT